MEKATVFIKSMRASIVVVFLFVNCFEIYAMPAPDTWIVYPPRPNSTISEYVVPYYKYNDDVSNPVHTHTYTYTYSRTPNLFAILITLSLFLICCRACCRYWCLKRALRPVHEGPANFHPSTITREPMYTIPGQNLYPTTFTKSSPADDLPPSYESVVGAGGPGGVGTVK